MTTAKLIALLREAQDFVERAAHVLEDPAYYADAKLFLARTNAALEETEPKVQWKFCAARMGRYSLHTYAQGWPTPTSWSCDVQLDDPTVYRHGFKTEKEAQDAAVALVLDWREE